MTRALDMTHFWRNMKIENPRTSNSENLLLEECLKLRQGSKYKRGTEESEISKDDQGRNDIIEESEEPKDNDDEQRGETKERETEKS